MSKGEEEQATGGRAGKQRKCIATEKVHCHQCQRGRLLEILSLMAMETQKTETDKEGSRCKDRKRIATGICTTKEEVEDEQ